MSARFPEAAVLDASVAGKLFAPDSDRPIAIALIQASQVLARPHFVVPDLFFVESVNAIRRIARGAKLGSGELLTKVKALIAIETEVIATRELTLPAVETAQTRLISFHDALYVAAAIARQLPLITADDRLVRALAGSPCRVLSLRELAA